MARWEMTESTPVRVCVRTRPTAAFSDEIAIDSAEHTVDIRQKTAAHDVVNNRQEAWSFRYHHVMHNSSQVRPRSAVHVCLNSCWCLCIIFVVGGSVCAPVQHALYSAA